MTIDAQTYTTQEALNEKLRGYSGELDLSEQNIGDTGAKARAEALPQSSLSSLILEKNRISDAGATALAPAIGKLGNLTILNLWDNPESPRPKRTEQKHIARKIINALSGPRSRRSQHMPSPTHGTCAQRLWG